jgi:hypothetical protein
MFDIATMTWTELTAFASGTSPSKRDGHGFTSLGGRLYMHGGWDRIGKSRCSSQTCLISDALDIVSHQILNNHKKHLLRTCCI